MVDTERIAVQSMLRIIVGGRRCRDVNIDSFRGQNQNNNSRCYAVPELRGRGGCVGKCSKNDVVAPMAGQSLPPERSTSLACDKITLNSHCAPATSTNSIDPLKCNPIILPQNCIFNVALSCLD